jgi:endonuclease/exonuclease/phosphatase family metal-dependent hydrolase
VQLTVATFNLNNLFSRFNFTGEVDSTGGDDRAVIETTTTFSFSDPTKFKLRTFQGKLVKGKPAAERALLAARIKELDADVVAVQEVEDVSTLQQFAATDLAGDGYRHVVLVEGNDPRLIDVGLLSRLPIGAVTSWRHAVHPDNPTDPVFSRDLLEVEILTADRSRRLLTVFNNHLKSHFVPPGEDPVAGAAAADARRRQQAEMVARIVAARTRPDSRYLVVGDMNDPPTSPMLAPLVSSPLGLVDGLAQAKEDKPAPPDHPPPPNRPWSERFKPAHQPAKYELLDQIWLSHALAPHLDRAFINRRRRLTGDGSDHDPAAVVLTL